MRNLRKIFEHIAFYNRAPAREIADLRARIIVGADISSDDRVLLGKVLDAVVDIATDEAKKAIKKASTTEG